MVSYSNAAGAKMPCIARDQNRSIVAYPAHRGLLSHAGLRVWGEKREKRSLDGALSATPPSQHT